MTRRHWHSCQPADLQALAREWFLAARRIELQKLAKDLGISRATAYRWAGSADELVGDVLAGLIDDTFKTICARVQSHGGERVLEVLERGMAYARRFGPLQELLRRNPELALKIVSGRGSRVQARTIENLRVLLEEEQRSGYMSLPVDARVLAYTLTRIVESFLYADAIAGVESDLGDASKILRLVLRLPQEISKAGRAYA